MNKEQNSQKEKNEEEQATAQILPLCMNWQDTQTRTAENKGTYICFLQGGNCNALGGKNVGFNPCLPAHVSQSWPIYFLCFKFCGVGLHKSKDTAALEQTRGEAESWRPGYHVMKQRSHWNNAYTAMY